MRLLIQSVPSVHSLPSTCRFRATDLLVCVLHLADRRMAVAAWYGADGPAHVDVVLLQVIGVRQIHGLPVAHGGGARQAGGRRRLKGKDCE